MKASVRPTKATSLIVISLLFLLAPISLKAELHAKPAGRIDLGMTNAKAQITPFGPTGSNWTVVPSPNTGSARNYFNGVAAIGTSDVWAVGGYGIEGEQAWQLVQHWDGVNWNVATPPALNIPNELLAVSAIATNDVWAVGGFNSGGQALIEHWDGASWTVV